MPLLRQELHTLPEFIPVFGGVRVAQSFRFLCSILTTIVCLRPRPLYLKGIVLSVLQKAASDYSIGIFKLFAHCHSMINLVIERFNVTNLMSMK